MKIGVVGMLGAVALTLAGCGQEKGVYSQSPEELRKIFATAKTEYKQTEDGFTRLIIGSGREGDRVKVVLTSTMDTALQRKCFLDFQAVDGGTKVVPDCSSAADAFAGGRTMGAFAVNELNEHVEATLAGRPFDAKSVLKKNGGAAMKNMKDMRQEALEAHDRQDWEAGDDARIQTWVDETVGAEMERIELEEAGW